MAETKKALTVVDGIKKMEGEFNAALPSHIPTERFLRNAVTVINGSPELLDDNVDRRSLYASVMASAQQGLMLDGREAALVSFNNKKLGKRVVQYIPMVEGLMKLVRNSGDISVISVHVVKENDDFDYELGDNERMLHKPALTERGKTIGAYSIVTLKDGGKSREWMDIDQINAIRDRKFGTPKHGPWVTDYDEMARKTVFRRHTKRLPKSTDLDAAIQHEDEQYSAAPVNVVNEPPVEQPKEKKETKAAAAVKAKAAKKAAKEAEPEPDEDGVIDADYTEVKETDEEELPV